MPKEMENEEKLRNRAESRILELEKSVVAILYAIKAAEEKLNCDLMSEGTFEGIKFE